MYSIATELSCTTNITHRKRDGRKFCVEVFSQGMEEHQTELYTRIVKTISLGMPRHPTGLTTLSVCTPPNFVFRAT